jgi:cytidylate kinase
MPKMKIIIAIDGHSSCGKSTLAKQMAQKLEYVYVDSGAMYRAVTLYAIQNNYIKNGAPDTEALIAALPLINLSFELNADKLPEILLNGVNVEKEIRSMEVSGMVSPVSTISAVRRFLVIQQRAIATQKGVVMDGRDIGTVVFPNAELKIFLTASAEVRAQRRFDELIEKGTPASYADVLANLQERDFIDSNRDDSPLKQADDAILLDNSNLTRQEQFDTAMQMVKSITG